MGTRLQLHQTLVTILGTDHVYFQPPSSIKMTYPAIVYSLDKVQVTKADDKPYLKHNRYQVQYISRNPENTVIDDILELPYSSYDRRFVADNLYHDNFDVYF